ncbi:asparagine synthase (glutamine-hydrolyzing), partial [Vibrio splendidus]
MCGLAGFLNPNKIDYNGNVIDIMINTIQSRGPDDSGHWCDHEGKVTLGHRRLAIVDLSSAGHQPMNSACDKYVIVFNGEIYNHLDLRDELLQQGVIFKWIGHSDTETILACIVTWGVDETVKKMSGMFAFALWDKESKDLYLCRDRLGEKPLYYGWQDDVFLFGSELKALKAHPSFLNEINRDSINLLLNFNYIPAPNSIYKGIYKLIPGSLLKLNIEDRNIQISKYWTIEKAIENQKKQSNIKTPKQAVDMLESTLKNAVKQQMMADVPLGAFLSGGVDSSAIVSLMQSQSKVPINTFSIGFDIDKFNEAEFAKAVAEHLGTNHTELYVTSEMALNIIPQLAQLYDEPFADSSQIPTFLVSKLAKEHVTVSLSGDGGDELFCGYKHYLQTVNLWNKINRFPLWARKLTSILFGVINENVWDHLFKLLKLITSRFNHWKNPGYKIRKGIAAISSTTVEELHLNSVKTWNDADALVLNTSSINVNALNRMKSVNGLDAIERLMTIDSMMYLPDDLLVKVDRAAMGVSLET